MPSHPPGIASKVKLVLPKGTRLVARVNLLPSLRPEQTDIVRKDLELVTPVPNPRQVGFVNIDLMEDLFINLDGHQKLRDCRCRLPGLDGRECQSLNSALTAVTRSLEGVIAPRRSFGGSVMKMVYFEEQGRWAPLEILRERVVPDSDVARRAQVKKFLSSHPEALNEILQNVVTSKDIVALAYRKSQLQTFEKLLNNQVAFEDYRRLHDLPGKERVWQHFLEINTWIFGYGLTFVFTSPLKNSELERSVVGNSLGQSGKRVDVLLKTRGAISSLCFVEIKTHETALLSEKSYRVSCYSISEELAGAVAQIQKTVQRAIEEHRRKLVPVVDDIETGEKLYLYRPRCFLVAGRLAEFQKEGGFNEEAFGSFELFRRHIASPEIITFDELYERARFIVEHTR